MARKSHALLSMKERKKERKKERNNQRKKIGSAGTYLFFTGV